MALGVTATNAWARITALLVETGQVQRALGVGGAFRSTEWWTSDERRDT